MDSESCDGELARSIHLRRMTGDPPTSQIRIRPVYALGVLGVLEVLEHL